MRLGEEDADGRPDGPGRGAAAGAAARIVTETRRGCRGRRNGAGARLEARRGAGLEREAERQAARPAARAGGGDQELLTLFLGDVGLGQEVGELALEGAVRRFLAVADAPRRDRPARPRLSTPSSRPPRRFRAARIRRPAGRLQAMGRGRRPVPEGRTSIPLRSRFGRAKMPGDSAGERRDVGGAGRFPRTSSSFPADRIREDAWDETRYSANLPRPCRVVGRPVGGIGGARRPGEFRSRSCTGGQCGNLPRARPRQPVFGVRDHEIEAGRTRRLLDDLPVRERHAPIGRNARCRLIPLPRAARR